MLNKITTNISKNYSPLYFLSALGAGGLSVTFFMYLLFMTSHEQTPIPIFESIDKLPLILAIFIVKLLLLVSIIAIIVFAIFHFLLLTANIKAYNSFKKTDGYQKLKTTNAEVQLMAPPLTFAMTVNVLFILGAVFVPNLWSVVEYLFPLAMLAFGVIGYIAIKIFLDYASRVFVNGSFEHSQNNNLSQMLAVFAFAMIGVGFSASSAMSHNQTTSLVAMVFAIFFLVVVILFAVIKLILGMYHMLEQGVDKTTSVSLWIFIPIATLVGIAIFRLDMALVHNFGATLDNSFAIVLFTTLFALQIVFGLLGYKVMKDNGYFADFDPRQREKRRFLCFNLPRSCTCGFKLFLFA
jgi:hypothetical protein